MASISVASRFQVGQTDLNNTSRTLGPFTSLIVSRKVRLGEQAWFAAESGPGSGRRR